MIKVTKRVCCEDSASWGSYPTCVFTTTTRAPLGAQQHSFSKVHNEDDESTLLVAAHESVRQCYGCFCWQVDDERSIRPSQSGRQQKRAKNSRWCKKTEVDMLIQDKQALLPLSAQQSSEVPRERIPSRLTFVNEVGQSSQTSSVTARMTAQGDQDPDVLSLS